MDSAQAAAVTPTKIRPTRCARFRPKVSVPEYRFFNVMNNEEEENLENVFDGLIDRIGSTRSSGSALLSEQRYEARASS